MSDIFGNFWHMQREDSILRLFKTQEANMLSLESTLAKLYDIVSSKVNNKEHDLEQSNGHQSSLNESQTHLQLGIISSQTTSSVKC